MMTRKEKLLVRPWQLRRYNNHKKKVINAVSVVDFGPPPQRRHVTIKLKKLQKEKERQMKIEEDNFKLLQHLGSIMRKKRVDNYWETQPPTFLRRVGIYHRTRTPTPCEETSTTITPEISTSRKSKCFACTPHREYPVAIPEERIPWDPPKKILTRRQSKSAVVPISSDFDFSQGTNRRISTSANEKEEKKSGNFGKKLDLPKISGKNLLKSEEADQKVVVRQGPLQIAINFPSFAEVKLVKGKSVRYLNRNLCECLSFQENKQKPGKKSAEIKLTEIIKHQGE